ncbi:MAG: hypothetical protein KDK76_07825 [Chlamydiia bacterium]|nr:hypothetical protein [Chlamydiia bacterium]
MPMQVEYFLNFCESIINLELLVLGDIEYQKKQWFVGDPRRGTYYLLIDEFLNDYQSLVETDEYSLFKGEKAFQSLEELYTQVDSFYLRQTQADSTIFNDQNWIDIVKKAQETTQLLTEFIKGQ